jgi:putative transcriptional regulator
MNRLAEMRKSAGLTQDALSKKAGVSRPYISNIERGKQTVITNTVMLKIAVALNKKVEEIFFN